MKKGTFFYGILKAKQSHDLNASIRPCGVWQPELVVNIYNAFDHDQIVSSELGLPCLHIYHNSDQCSSCLCMH